MSTKGFEETIDYNKEMKVVEEFLNIDSSLVEMEKNKDLIRMEMNIVEFPIFSKSNNIKVNQIKKYYFSTDKSSFLLSQCLILFCPAVSATITCSRRNALPDSGSAPDRRNS